MSAVLERLEFVVSALYEYVLSMLVKDDVQRITRNVAAVICLCKQNVRPCAKHAVRHMVLAELRLWG